MSSYVSTCHVLASELATRLYAHSCLWVIHVSSSDGRRRLYEREQAKDLHCKKVEQLVLWSHQEDLDSGNKGQYGANSSERVHPCHAEVISERVFDEDGG